MAPIKPSRRDPVVPLPVPMSAPQPARRPAAMAPRAGLAAGLSPEALRRLAARGALVAATAVPADHFITRARGSQGSGGPTVQGDDGSTIV